MSSLKKLIFAPLFLVLLTSSIYFYKLILDKYLNVFFGNYGGIYEFSLLAVPLVFASLAYCLFVTFTQDLKYAAAVAGITILVPFAFLSTSLSIVISIGLVISLIIVYFNLQTNLRNYVNFQPTNLLKGPIKLLNVFILFTLTFGYFLNANSIVQTKGFKIPEPIIDWAINFSTSSQSLNFKGEKYLAQALTPEQIELLKQNPDILKQYGLNPKDLESLSPASKQQTTSDKSAIKALPLPSGNLKDVLKNQINGMLDQTLKPYLFVIPILLAFMFYSLASLIMWVISLFLSPLISLIFYLLEKTGFVKYEKEMREVKKIVI